MGFFMHDMRIEIRFFTGVFLLKGDQGLTQSGVKTSVWNCLLCLWSASIQIVRALILNVNQNILIDQALIGFSDCFSIFLKCLYLLFKQLTLTLLLYVSRLEHFDVVDHLIELFIAQNWLIENRGARALSSYFIEGHLRVVSGGTWLMHKEKISSLKNYSISTYLSLQASILCKASGFRESCHHVRGVSARVIKDPAIIQVL